MVGGKAVLICFLAAQIDQTTFVEASCGSENAEEQFYFSTSVLQSTFSTPWSQFDAKKHENPFDERTAVEGMDDCGADGGAGKIFFFGGSEKYGLMEHGRIFDPQACVCADDDFKDCSECPTEDKIEGVWFTDVDEDYTGEKPPLRDSNVVVHNDDASFFIFGGYEDEADLWEYNIESRNYTKRASMPGNGRIDVCGAWYNGKLFIFGGTDMKTEAFTNQVMEYDAATDSWSEAWAYSKACTLANNSACPVAREDMVCASSPTGKGFVLIGGSSEYDDVLGDAWLFDVERKDWRRLESKISSLEDAVAYTDKQENRIYIQGGKNKDGIHYEVIHVLDMSAGSDTTLWEWIDIPTAHPAPLVTDHCGGLANGKLYSFSGEIIGADKKPDMFVWDYKSRACPYECSGKGACDSNGICRCDMDARGIDCNEKVIIVTEYEIPPALLAWMAGINGLLAVVSIVVTVLYFSFRSRPAIRATLPFLNMYCLLGCTIACLGVVFHAYAFSETVGTTSRRADVLCFVGSVWFPLSFALIFGSLFGKVKRVADVFNNVRLLRLDQKKLRRDLASILGGILLLECLFLLLWFITSPPKYTWILIPGKNKFEEQYYGTCVSENDRTWILTITLVNFLFLLYGGYLAYKTRKVAFFIDSKTIGFALYNLIVASFPIVVLSPALSNSPRARFVCESMAVALGVGGILALLMIPNLLKRNMTRDQVREVAGRATADRSATNETTTKSHGDTRVEYLEKRVRELEQQLGIQQADLGQASSFSSAPHVSAV